MDIVIILLIAAAVFGLCWLLDKGFTKLFRSQPQHMSGKAVRLNKRFASGGFLLCFLGITALLAGITNANLPLIIGSWVIILVGAGLIVYYLSTGIYYDEDTFLYSSFGKKSQAYRYSQIEFQKLYAIQGGSMLIELHMRDGNAIGVLSQMPDYEKFLAHAKVRWCRQKGLLPEEYPSNPEAFCWFPERED